MKVKAVIIMLLLIVAVFSGCAKKSNTNNSATDPTAGATSPTVAPTTAATTVPTTAPTTAATTAPTTAPTTTPDAVTTASIVDTNEAFMKAISKSGTWIIALTKDLTIPDQELLLEGEFKNGKKDDAGKDQIQRKIALYTQDEKRNITARFTLTAPKLIIASPMASIQHGTFKGDVVVTVTDFQLVDATVDGNVYFTSQEVKNSFKMDDKSKITGKQEIQ